MKTPLVLSWLQGGGAMPRHLQFKIITISATAKHCYANLSLIMQTELQMLSFQNQQTGHTAAMGLTDMPDFLWVNITMPVRHIFTMIFHHLTLIRQAGYARKLMSLPIFRQATQVLPGTGLKSTKPHRCWKAATMHQFLL